MRTVQQRRIGPHEGERLLTGRSTDSDHTWLARLLAAAAAPATPDELTGERLALAAYELQARSWPRPTPTRKRRTFAVPLTRMAAVKAIAVLAAVSAGGTAFAAETGRLPGRVQQQAHHLFSALGVPAPHTDSGLSGGNPGGVPAPSGSPSAEATLRADGAASVALCRTWDTARRDPNGKAVAADTLRLLTKAAGNAAGIPAYCATVLAADTQARPSSAPTPAPPPSSTNDKRPGNGSGNGAGSGGGHPPPGPHR
jgi:hypothetical protein